MRILGALFGLMFMGLLGLVFFDQLAGLATSGDLTGTNQQAVFDIFPSAVMFIAVMAVGLFVIFGFSVVFLRKGRL